MRLSRCLKSSISSPIASSRSPTQGHPACRHLGGAEPWPLHLRRTVQARFQSNVVFWSKAHSHEDGLFLVPARLGRFCCNLRPFARPELCGSRRATFEATESAEGDSMRILGRI